VQRLRADVVERLDALEEQDGRAGEAAAADLGDQRLECGTLLRRGFARARSLDGEGVAEGVAEGGHDGERRGADRRCGPAGAECFCREAARA
jgi:hypothetical protein